METRKIGHQKQKRKIKLGWIIILFILIFFSIKAFGPINLDTRVVITKGDNVSEFLQNLPKIKQLGLKFRIKFGNSDLDISKISEGTYTFSGKYSQIEFLNTIAEGPKTNYIRYTVLEGRSIYDIDYDLTKKGYINEGEYISFVTDPTYISRYQNRYEFMSKVSNLSTMEGFLYPDTYNIDSEGNFIDQLVYLQLENFKNKVWTPNVAEISKFEKKLGWYEILSLASIIEKEEKSSKNRPTIAGIFLNRLDNNMTLGADITLCYGLEQPYETCTPNVIAKSVNDTSNIYNTRQQKGITPQPISNPSADSVSAVLNYKKTDYFYYLHDNSGNIHYGKTLQEHNENKSKYL